MGFAVLGLVQSNNAWAGDWGGGAKCAPRAYTCTVSATVAGALPSPAHTVPIAGGSTSSPICRDLHDRPVPCYDPQFGYFDSRAGCYYALDVTFQPPPTDTADRHPPGSGNWYDVTCPGVGGTAGGIVWFAKPPAGPPPLPSPAVLAVSAERMLLLPAPSIASSPSAEDEQLVGLPVWLWLDGASASARSATASASNGVASVSVTATARVSKVVWSLGDGASVLCAGPGTPYVGSGDPKAASPDCGHTYRRSSAHAPDGRFPVNATVSWQVSWSGAGQGGTLPPITRTARTTFAVAESQAIND